MGWLSSARQKAIEIEGSRVHDRLLRHEFFWNFHRVRHQCRILAVLLFLGIACAKAQTNPDCAISQTVSEADPEHESTAHPTHLRLMPSRYVDLLRANRGFKCSGLPLVAFDGMHYQPTAPADDQGLFLIVPQVARVLRLKVGAAADLSLMTTLVLSGTIGLLGFMSVSKTSLGRRVGVAALVLVSAVELAAGDVYLMAAAPSAALVPWIIFFHSRRKVSAGMFLIMAGAGIVAEASSFIRAHAGIGLALFVLIVVIGAYRVKLRFRIGLILTLLAGMIGTAFWFQHLYAQRDEFLRANPAAMIRPTHGHVFWHAAYLGLSWIKNSEIPAYKDEIAFAKVKELRPEVAAYSPEYEQILRRQVIDLARRAPGLIIANVLLKLAVVLIYCIGGANIGLYAAKLAPKHLAVEFAFWLAIAFYALPGILVVPHASYMLGLIVFAALYGAYSVEFAARNPAILGRLRYLCTLLLLKQENDSVKRRTLLSGAQDQSDACQNKNAGTL